MKDILLRCEFIASDAEDAKKQVQEQNERFKDLMDRLEKLGIEKAARSGSNYASFARECSDSQRRLSV